MLVVYDSLVYIRQAGEDVDCTQEDDGAFGEVDLDDILCMDVLDNITACVLRAFNKRSKLQTLTRQTLEDMAVLNKDGKVMFTRMHH